MPIVAANPMFWHEKIETLNRPALEALQIKRLRNTVERVARVPFYRKKFLEASITPEVIQSADDVRRLPFTNAVDLRENYPDGLLAIPREEVLRLHTSSGTTGKPKAVFFTRTDIDNAAELIARAFCMTGVTRHDVFQNMMGYGLFTGGLMMHYGAEKLGCMVIPAGPGPTERQLMLMQDFGTTVIHITPSYAFYFSDFLEKKGIEARRDLRLRRAFIGAEPYTEETRIKIETALGINVYNSYGLTEMNGPGVAFECEHKCGMHIWEDNFIVEVINPATDEAVKEGETGELVLTSINREAMPLLRYRTHDLTSLVPGLCACGRTHRRIRRIAGRSDDMLIVRGVNIFPQQIERVLMGMPQIGRNYQIQLEGLDELTVKVELAPSSFDGQVGHLAELQNLVAEKLRAEIWVRPKVDLVATGSLPVTEGKAKRVIDKRSL